MQQHYTDNAYEHASRIFDAKSKAYICSPWLSKEYAERFVEMAKKGCKLRIITGNDTGNLETAKYLLDEMAKLPNLDVKLVSSERMHSKFFVKDDDYAVSGSMNFTINGLKRQFNYYTESENTEEVKQTYEIFMKIWLDYKGESLSQVINDKNEKPERVEEKIYNSASIEKAHNFEKYVRSLFSENYFEIVLYTEDVIDEGEASGEIPNKEVYCYPDYKIKYKRSGEVFALKCKYSSVLPPNELLEWTKQKRLDQYRDYAEKEKIPFYIVIGLEGESEKPQRMFCLPLTQAKYPALYPSIYLDFERAPTKMFFWKNGKLS